MANKKDKQEYLSEIQTALFQEFGLAKVSAAFDEWRESLVLELSRLITHDFSRLVAILYRLDVSETKLKHLLKQHPSADAAVIIADLIIERQVEKIKTRKKFRDSREDIDEDEKW